MSLIDLINKKSILPSSSEALPGRSEEMEIPEEHFVKGTRLKEPFPNNLEKAIFGMGCFWGVEKNTRISLNNIKTNNKSNFEEN